MNLSWNRSSIPDRPGSDRAGGFTLFEMLIAMALTAIIGAVLFRTWDLVMHSGQDVQAIVRDREAERIAFGVLDNDLTAIVPPSRGRLSTLPPISREAIVPPDIYYEVTGRKKPDEEERDSVLLSFTTATSASPQGGRLGSLYCVEYRLRRSGTSSLALVRRERALCGIPGDFPWTEMVLLRRLHSARVQLVLAGGQVVEEWEPSQQMQPREIRLILRHDSTSDEEELVVPLLPGRIDIDWEK